MSWVVINGYNCAWEISKYKKQGVYVDLLVISNLGLSIIFEIQLQKNE